MKRHLILREGSADKFWRIEADGDNVNVHYGRSGTTGQRQVKAHGDEAAAQAAADKLVAAKLKKGYVDDPESADVPNPDRDAAPRPSPSSRPETQGLPRNAAVSVAPAEPPAQTPTPEPFEIPWFSGDDIGLLVSPFDAAMNLDSPLPPMDTATDFDEEEALSRVRRSAHVHPREKVFLTCGRFAWIVDEPPLIAIPATEGATWWRHMARCNASTDEAAMAAILKETAPPDQPRHVNPLPDITPGTTIAIEAAFTSPDAVLARLTKHWRWADENDPRDYDYRGMFALPARALLPLCSTETLDEARNALPRTLPSVAVVGSYDTSFDGVTLIVAAALGGREAEVAQRLAEIPNSALGRRERYEENRFGVQVAICASTPAERIQLARRIGVRPSGVEDVITWLVGTQGAGLETLADWIDDSSGVDTASFLMNQAASMLHGPGAVPFFARLATGSRAGNIALDWLNRHLDAVLASSVPDVLADTVKGVLRSLSSERLRVAREGARGGTAHAIDGLLIEATLPVFGANGYPNWWADALPAEPSAPAEWVSLRSLAPLTIDGERLSLGDLALVLGESTTAGPQQLPPPLLAAIREHASLSSRDRLAISLFNSWLSHGAPFAEKWLLPAAGMIGHDGYARHLAPLIRQWPGQQQHQRAVAGLWSLAAVGTDVALQQISGIAAKVKFPAIKVRAGEAMEQIATQLGMSRGELEDRIVPDSGLDKSGVRRFDYGPRAFLVGINPQTKLVVREVGPDGRPTGKPRATLPAPNRSDDPELAQQAKANFTALRKDLTSLAKTQVARMEQAMISGRTWSVSDHAELIAGHPLLRSLLAPAIWAIVDPQGKIRTTARLDETGVLVDLEDEPVDVKAIHSADRIILAHPVTLSAETIRGWSHVLADYELAAPFPQLDRPTFALPEGQPATAELKGLPREEFPGTTLVRAFGKQGWTRGAALDNGYYVLHYLPFPALKLTAIIVYSGGMSIGLPPVDQEDQAIEAAAVIEGLLSTDQLGWGQLTGIYCLPSVPWTQVPATVVSEVLATLHAIADRG